VRPVGPPSVPGKLLGLLGLFTPEQSAYTVTQLSRRSGLPLTTTYRLVRELTEWGALERDDDGVYRIGLRLVEVASLCPRGAGLRDTALPYMEDLYEVTHQNVQLAVRDGLEIVYVERIAGRAAVNVRTKVGARWPLHATGVGLVLLAYAPVQVVDEVLATPLKTFTERTISTPRELRTALAEVRRSGVAISDRQITMDACSIAAPVRDPSGDVVASVSIVVPDDEPNRLAWIPAVRAAAMGISRALLPARGGPSRVAGQA
jgi:DNA-binding IclR family transcriptional regulator